jgi:hypothetical protein
MTTPNIDLGKFGVFTLGGIFFEDPTVEQAQEIEHLGYDMLWVSGSPPAELSFAEPLLESTTALKVATGRIIEVVRTFIPSERWPEVQAALRGEAPIRKPEARPVEGIEIVDIDDSDEDGY